LHIRLQSLGDIHPHTIATRELYAHLMQEQAYTGDATASCSGPEGMSDPRRDELHENGDASPLHKEVTPAPSEDDPLQAFLDACCDLHPRAWCRSAQLWQTYLQWVEKQQERYPLSRRAFIAQLKKQGCRADRTRTARIWHGIALVSKAP
ncbi:MAG TPA: hypothetical protein VKR06_35625, partial [Ktedonosporobacter sp.]|nr:hypothetical protein [Ktedonosporobacter sp.]